MTNILDKLKLHGLGDGGAKAFMEFVPITLSPVAPSNPVVNDIWVKTARTAKKIFFEENRPALTTDDMFIHVLGKEQVITATTLGNSKGAISITPGVAPSLKTKIATTDYFDVYGNAGIIKHLNGVGGDDFHNAYRWTGAKWLQFASAESFVIQRMQSGGLRKLAIDGTVVATSGDVSGTYAQTNLTGDLTVDPVRHYLYASSRTNGAGSGHMSMYDLDDLSLIWDSTVADRNTSCNQLAVDKNSGDYFITNFDVTSSFVRRHKGGTTGATGPSIASHNGSGSTIAKWSVVVDSVRNLMYFTSGATICAVTLSDNVQRNGPVSGAGGAVYDVDVDSTGAIYTLNSSSGIYKRTYDGTTTFTDVYVDKKPFATANLASLAVGKGDNLFSFNQVTKEVYKSSPSGADISKLSLAPYLPTNNITSIDSCRLRATPFHLHLSCGYASSTVGWQKHIVIDMDTMELVHVFDTTPSVNGTSNQHNNPTVPMWGRLRAFNETF